MTSSTYEMLWDCKFCGARKLLGLTHRHCPNCGASQNVAERYFPSDAEQVQVEEHVYSGADVVCAHCGHANGKRSKHCAGCGSALGDLPEVARREDQVTADGTAFEGQSVADARRELEAAAPPDAQRPATKWALIFGGASLVVIVMLVATFTWTQRTSLVVTGHTWQRGIAIERFGPVTDSAWCESVPQDARDIEQRREVRSTRRVPNGEKCSTRRSDNGDGTYSSRRVCKTVYRREEIYDDRCRFVVDRWREVRVATASGTSIDTLRWPAANLARAGSCIGCERTATATASYTLRFAKQGVANQTAVEHTCRFDEALWRSIADGSRWQGKVRVIGSALNCKSLAAE